MAWGRDRGSKEEEGQEGGVKRRRQEKLVGLGTRKERSYCKMVRGSRRGRKRGRLRGRGEEGWEGGRIGRVVSKEE